MKQLYLSVPQRIQLDCDEVKLGDIAQIIAEDKNLAEQVKSITLFRFGQKKMEICGIVQIYEKITEKFSDLNIVNLGETEFIIEKKKQKKINKALEFTKVGFVCGIVYFGSAFSVMTFNEDGCVRDLLDMLYLAIIGKPHEEGFALELAYSVGITAGILVFYNHVFRKKKDTDPTPIQVEMRQYEKDVNETTIINRDREGGN